jgi:hypothetical protein
MTGNAPPPSAAPEDREPELDWLEDLEEDLRRVATRPVPNPGRGGLLGRLLDPRD